MYQRFLSHLREINPVQMVLELIIVFIGVYLAFLFSSYQSESRFSNDRTRVLELVNLGIDRYQKRFEGFALGHDSYNREFLAQLQRSEVPDFGDVTYPAPQYPIDAIKFILTDESFDLFEVGLYVPLTAYVNAFERVMYVEEKLVQLAEEYQPLPAESHPDYDYLRAVQLQKARRYLRYLEIRKRTSEEIVALSRELAGLLAE